MQPRGEVLEPSCDGVVLLSPGKGCSNLAAQALDCTREWRPHDGWEQAGHFHGRESTQGATLESKNLYEVPLANPSHVASLFVQSVLLLRTAPACTRNVDIVDTQAARCLQQNGNGQFRLQKTFLSRGWQASCLPFHELSAASMVGCAPYWCEQAPVVQSQAARRLARRTLLEAERLPKARIERRVGKNLGCVTPAQATKVNVGAKSRKRALVNAGMTNSRKRVTGISRKRSQTH